MSREIKFRVWGGQNYIDNNFENPELLNKKD